VRALPSLLGAALLAVQASPTLAGGDVARGAQVFSSRCAVCHSAAKGGPIKIGPNLFAVVGRRAGTFPGYTYSPAMQKSGIVWSAATLGSYLTQPATAVPGNKMAFAGVSDAGTRDDLIAYLGSLK
jgi:cytochrome c